jgi:hypothetical protein
MLNRSLFKRLTSVLAAVGVLAVAGSVSASNRMGTITELTIGTNTTARVAVTGTTSGPRPTCHNTDPAHATFYAFSVADSKGKALFAALQAAQLAGKRVTVHGDSATCTDVVSTTLKLETLTLLQVWTN